MRTGPEASKATQIASGGHARPNSLASGAARQARARVVSWRELSILLRHDRHHKFPILTNGQQCQPQFPKPRFPTSDNGRTSRPCSRRGSVTSVFSQCDAGPAKASQTFCPRNAGWGQPRMLGRAEGVSGTL